MSQATWQAKSAFDAAARAGDVARMTASFSEDALLITPKGDSIRGRNAIVQHIIQLVPDAISASFSFWRDGRFELCRGSGRERISYAAHINYASRSPDSVSGNLSVLWKPDSAGNLKVVWVAFSEQGISGRLGRSECRLQEDSIWRAWRLSISVYPAAAFGGSASSGSFEHTLRARGWVAPEDPRGFGPPTPKTTSTGLHPSLVGIQYHIRRQFVVEVLGGGTTKGSTLGARFLTRVDHAQTKLSYSATFAGALISYEQSGIQLGVGPGVQFARWRLWEWYRPGSCCSSITEVRWSRSPIGVIGDARYHRLILGPLYLAIRVQVRRFPKARTPGTPRFPPALVDQGSSFVGIGLGGVL